MDAATHDSVTIRPIGNVDTELAGTLAKSVISSAQAEEILLDCELVEFFDDDALPLLADTRDWLTSMNRRLTFAGVDTVALDGWLSLTR